MIQVTFLGTGAGATFGSKRAKSSILISSPETNIILDMGNGGNSRLEDIGFPEVNSIFFTHLHIDHFNGVFDYLVQRKIRRMPTIRIHSPPGFRKIFSTFVEVGNEIDAEIIENDLPKAKIADLEIYSVKACHKIYAVSYVITDGSKKIIYSGDTREPCEDILKESRDADLIIHEGTCLEGCEIYGHTPIPKLYEFFDKKKVIVTHVPTQLEEAILSRVKDIKIAYDGMKINV